MDRQRRRILKKRAAASGDKRIQALLNVLNHGQNPRFHPSIVVEFRSLVKQLRDLDELFRSNPKLFRQDNGEHIEIFKQINLVLSRYKVFLRILYSFRYGKPNPQGWESAWFRANDSEQECIEMQLILTIIEIAQNERIQLLVQCQECKKWLFARVSSQKFCSEKCRDKFHSSNEADKKRRAAWARQKYARKVRSKKGV